MAGTAEAPLKSTPLAALHRELGARLVPFAGYEMPVQYPTGILAEHSWTRESAGLFDVSHMGQATLSGPDHATIAAALESLVPGDMTGLGAGRQRYTVLTTDGGGIVDDLMVARSGGEGRLFLVVNAARKEVDYARMADRLPAGIDLEPHPGRALLALQGPKAAEALVRHVPGAAEMGFMAAGPATFDGLAVHVSRSGYTGEDGFEISVAAEDAETVARALLAEPEVKPAGLGARDSLRLEAGLCLYGNDIDETTSPVEADLAWVIGKRRRAEGGFPGAERVLGELREGAPRRRIGLRPEGRAPAREGAPITDGAGRRIGVVTSGGYGPTVGGPIAMGYIMDPDLAAVGTRLGIVVRGQELPAAVVALPFVPHRYKR